MMELHSDGSSSGGSSIVDIKYVDATVWLTLCREWARPALIYAACIRTYRKRVHYLLVAGYFEHLLDYEVLLFDM